MNVNVKTTIIQNAPSVVRVATAKDGQEVWRLFLQGHRENGIFKLSIPKVQWLLNRVLCPDLIPIGDTGTRGIIGVIGTPESLEGLVLLIIGQYWYSEELHLEECLVFVDPEHRRSDHAKSLVQWMKDQVEATKLPLITGIISNIRTEAKCRLYGQMMPKAGEFFLVRPKSQSTIGSSLIVLVSSR